MSVACQKSAVLPLLAVMLAVLLAQGLSAAPLGYVVNSDGFDVPNDQIDNLYQIDLANGNTTRIGPVGYIDIEGLGLDANGQLFGVDDDTNTLVSINKQTGAAFPVAGLSGNLRLNATQLYDFGLTFTCDGLALLTADNTRQIYSLSKQTGVATMLGNSGPSLTGLAAWGDTVYGLGDQNQPNLYRVDATTGAATLIGPLTNAAPYTDGGLDFDADGQLWAVTDRSNAGQLSQVLKIDKITGVATVIAETLGGIESLAVAPPGGCDVNGGGGGGGGGNDLVSDVPTMSWRGMLAMVLLLGLAGLVAVWRHD